MKKNTISKETIFFIITVIILLIVVAFNNIVKDIRITELKNVIQDENYRHNDYNHIYLIAKYQNRMSLYYQKSSQDDFDKMEYRINTIMKQSSDKEDSKHKFSFFIKNIVISLVNLYRPVFKKEKIGNYDNNLSPSVEAGYYAERNNYFSKAIILYDAALRGKNLSKYHSDSVMLHRGFCYSMMGLKNKSRDIYGKLINSNAEENIILTAIILLQYLDKIDSELNNINNESSKDIDKGIKYFYLLAYNDALNIFNDKESQNSINSDDRTKIKYFKARCLEETEHPENALEYYSQIINENPESQYAIYSNRRIYIIGKTLQKKSGISEISEANNLILRDTVLDSMIKENKNVNTRSLDSTEKFFSENLTILQIQEKLNGKIEKMSRLKQMPDKSYKFKLNEKNNETLRITTKSGTIIIGKIIENNGNQYTIDTIIGRVIIEKNEISKIIKVDQ